MVRDAPGAHEVVERRHQQPPCQVAAGAEDNHCAGRRAVAAQWLLGRIGEAVVAVVHAVIPSALLDGRRTACASPTGSSRRRCGPAASGTACTARPTTL